MNKPAAIILAAGKGRRMNSTTLNKVMLPVNNKPLLDYTVENLHIAGIHDVVIVVGYARDSVINYFNNKVQYAEQNDQTGTAHALSCGLKELSNKHDVIISLYGDDSYGYPSELYKKMLRTHRQKRADMTVLTIVVQDPFGLGRIVRNKKNQITSIVEEKDATFKQKRIHEINTGFYIFERLLLNKYLPKIQNKNNAREYYLTDILSLALLDRRTIADVCEENLPWRGVNSPQELKKAQSILK